tara:strand:- start:681 stop:998 length:318 start_codon:yes stop_codon:yes gene_type:complete
MKTEFNKNQMIKVYEIIDNMNQENTSLRSNYKNEGLECFYDKNKNFMLRYCNMTFGDGGLIMNHVYKIITPEGEVKNGNEVFKSDAEAHNWTKQLKSIDIQDLTI